MADPTPEQRAVMDQTQEELTAWAETQIVGAVEAGMWMIRAQEMANQWAERMNAEPLEQRIKFLEYVAPGKFDPENIAEVKLACGVEPIDNDPTCFTMTYHADVRYHRTVEEVFFTVKVE